MLGCTAKLEGVRKFIQHFKRSKSDRRALRSNKICQQKDRESKVR
jgi:hypothetical protein